MGFADDTSTPALTTRGALRRTPELSDVPAAFRRVIRTLAQTWLAGAVTFVLPSGREIRLLGEHEGPDARLVIHDYRCMRRVVTGGDVGFAEGYVAGEWDSPDLSALLVAFSLNWDRLARAISGNPLVWAINKAGHLLRPNTRHGARRNIHAHYDLGNAFYAQWLDPTMTYSSARYETPGQPLEAAQIHKYRTLAQSIDLRPGMHVLEIGCGWGGFAEFAAKEIGAKVTGVTISQEQHAFARQRMVREGLSEAVDIQLVDYRDVHGAYDRVVSIEMFEAVGERYWPAYFGKIRDVLHPDGRAGLQIITIRDDLFEHYRSRTDFIQRYIFPGGMLPSAARLKAVTAEAGLAWREATWFAQHYADTLAEWATRFERAWESIRPLGFDERFRRLWRFYLSYCEAGFRTERTNVTQLTLSRA
jgi:cyclopropane-fatty-acyl-phospholipid synthase